jgi:hypothetical protein
MGAILGLERWRRLNESSEVKVFFHFRVPDSKYDTPSNHELIRRIFKKIQKIYPDAVFHGFSQVITVPNKIFANQEGKYHYFNLDFIDKRISTTEKMPDLLMTAMEKFSEESNYSDSRVFSIEAKPEYASLSAEELKQRSISSIIKENGLISDITDFENELTAYFLLCTVGAGLYSDKQKNEFLLSLLNSEAYLDSIEKIKATQIYRTESDEANAKKNFAEQREKLMIDYSGFTGEKLNSAITAIFEYLNRLSAILGNKGKSVDRLVEEELVTLLQHCKKYPELWAKLALH